MLSAAQLHARGVTAMQAGRVRSARLPLRQALTRTADDALLGAIEKSLAYVEAELGDTDEAARLCNSALGRRGIDAATRAAIHGQQALLLTLAGRIDESIAQYDVAIEELADAPAFLGPAHVNRGNLFLFLRDAGHAGEDLAIGLQLLVRSGASRAEVAMAEHNLGYAKMLEGDLPGALAAMDRARETLAPLSAVSQATCDQDRAEVLMAAGLIVEAQQALASAARALGAARLGRRQGEAELVLARALLATDPTEAGRVAARAARRFTRESRAQWRLRADALRVLAVADARRITAADLTRTDLLVRELHHQRLSSVALEVALAGVRMRVRRGDLDGASDRLRRIRVARGASLSVRLLADDVRAEMDAARQRPEAALTRIRRGLEELHAWQSSFGSLDLQTNLVGQGVGLGVRGLNLAVRSRSDAVMFEWSERARMLASRVQPVRAPQDADSVADLSELRGGPAPDREAELRRRIRERAWQQRGSGLVTDPVGLTELAAALGDRSALAAYVVTADRVVGLVVTDAGTRRHELGDRATLDGMLGGLLADLDMSAGELPATLAGAVRTALNVRLATLADLLVTPLLPDLGDRSVVLTPSGVLAGVPWTLLPGLAGRPVTQAQSATSWLARSGTPLRTATAGFVAGPGVRRAEAEVRAVAAQWSGAHVLTGVDARADAVTDLAGRVDVLHVAAHGRHSAENPLFSGLELADGTWFGYDIDQLSAVPDVVLLSACEVGRSSVRWGEELIGMTSAWLHAGARCVIASAAAVDDTAAYDALVAVHAGVAAGLHPAAALAGAPRSGGAPAPFVCFG